MGFIDPDGVEHEVDIIICATGFDTSYNLKYPVYVNGIDVKEKWRGRDKVPSYLKSRLRGGRFRIPADAVEYSQNIQVPIYFVNGGQYCPSAHRSFFPIIQGIY